MKPPRNGLLLALGVMVLAGLEVGLNDAIEPKWAALVTELPLALALAWRRRLPLVVLAIVALGTGLEWSLGVSVAQPLVPLLALVIAMYSVAVNEPLRRAVLGFVLVNAGLAVALIHIRGHSDITVGSFAFGTIICGGAWAAGLVVRSRTQRAGALERETERQRRHGDDRFSRDQLDEHEYGDLPLDQPAHRRWLPDEHDHRADR